MRTNLAERRRLLNLRDPLSGAVHHRADRLPPLILVTDEARLPDPAAAIRRLPRGAAVILRHYGAPDRAGLARRLAALCRRLGVRLLVAGDWRLAATVGAGGVHLPEAAAGGADSWGEGRPPPARFRHRRRPFASALWRAARPCRRALLSPAFPTASTPALPHRRIRFAACVAARRSRSTPWAATVRERAPLQGTEATGSPPRRLAGIADASGS